MPPAPPRASAIESVTVLDDVEYEALPAPAVERLVIAPGQRNLLLRVVLSDLERTLTSEQANQLRDRIYAALHRGARAEWASDGPAQGAATAVASSSR